jgi:glucan phosphorylase
MDVHDTRDADVLYRILREEVIPLNYQRDRNGLPRGWIKRMKRTIRTLGWRFNADRMVMDHAEMLCSRSWRQIERHESRGMIRQSRANRSHKHNLSVKPLLDRLSCADNERVEIETGWNFPSGLISFTAK